MDSIEYGIGGYLPAHPNGNVRERVTDHGDGTATRTRYDADGNETDVVELTGLPVAAVESDLPAEIAAARASLATATTVAQVRTRTLALIDLIASP